MHIQRNMVARQKERVVVEEVLEQDGYTVHMSQEEIDLLASILGATSGHGTLSMYGSLSPMATSSDKRIRFRRFSLDITPY